MRKTAALLALFVLSLALASCGSSANEQASETTKKMPNVAGQSLTSAIATLDKDGIAWEASPDAAADDSDSYDVCATTPAAGLDAPAGDTPAKLKVAKSFGCDKSQSPKSATQSSTTTKDASDEADVAKPEESSGEIRVPDVVGKSHQFGQDAMQEVGLYNLAEEDVTGQDRMLLIDRNWVVVRQRPKAGSLVNEDTTIILYSKKYTDD